MQPLIVTRSNGLLRPSPNLIERPKSAVSIRSEHERAGGIEDWEDVNGHDVDRYGFNKRGSWVFSSRTFLADRIVQR